MTITISQGLSVLAIAWFVAIIFVVVAYNESKDDGDTAVNALVIVASLFFGAILLYRAGSFIVNFFGG